MSPKKIHLFKRMIISLLIIDQLAFRKICPEIQGKTVHKK